MRVTHNDNGTLTMTIQASPAERSLIQRAIVTRNQMHKRGCPLPDMTHDDSCRGARALADICEEWLCEILDEEDEEDWETS